MLLSCIIVWLFVHFAGILWVTHQTNLSHLPQLLHLPAQTCNAKTYLDSNQHPVPFKVNPYTPSVLTHHYSTLDLTLVSSL